MKFELNKKYKLRGGGWGMPVYLFPDSCGYDYALLVIIKPLLCAEFEEIRNREGFVHGPNKPMPYDLLPELYVEPVQPKKLYAYIHDGGLGETQVSFFKTDDGPIGPWDRAPEYDLVFRQVAPSPLTDTEKEPLE